MIAERRGVPSHLVARSRRNHTQDPNKDSLIQRFRIPSIVDEFFYVPPWRVYYPSHRLTDQIEKVCQRRSYSTLHHINALECVPPTSRETNCPNKLNNASRPCQKLSYQSQVIPRYTNIWSYIAHKDFIRNLQQR